MKIFLNAIVGEIQMMFKVHLRVASVLFLLPVIYTLMFGGLFYKNTLTDVPIAICNLDDGFQSQQIIKDLSDTPEIKVIAVETSATDFDNLIVRGELAGAVVIPKDYSKNLNNGGSTSIELIVDNKNTVLSGTASRAVQSVINNHNAINLVNRRIAGGWSQTQAQSSLNLSSRIFYNPTGGYIDFFLAPLIVHSLQIAIVFVLAPSFVLEKKYRKMELSKNPLIVLIAKSFVYVIYEVAIMAICLAIGIGGFNMVCHGDFSKILLLISAFIFCMNSFALLVGSWLNVSQKAITMTLFYIMPSILFSGAIWPRYSMDNFSLFLSYIMPIGYTADDLRSLLVKGEAINLTFHVEILTLIGILFFALAIVGVKKYVRDNAARVKTTVA